MKRWMHYGLLGLLIVFGSGLFPLRLSAETPSSPEIISRGRELFHKKEALGVKYACILCHQKEKAVKHSEVEKLGDKLPSVINKYIQEKAKGKPLDAASDDMKALAAYITHEHSK